MTAIEELESEIEETVTLLDAARERAATSPSAELTAASLEARLRELERQLHQEKARRGKEILELRFSGEIADLGSLPLELLGNITKDIAHALGHAARHRKFGTQGRLLKSVTEELDLRLEGIGGGSTRLYISGETAPDLFGNSLIESTLYDTFQFLQHTDEEDQLPESVSHVGEKAADALRSFFQAVGDANLTTEITWETPKTEEIVWSVSAEGARRLATSLSRLVSDGPEELKLVGQVVTVSSKRPLEIRDAKGNDYQIRVPSIYRDFVKNLVVDQWIAAVVEKRSVRNEATGKARATYILQSRPIVIERP